jgi:hypothetical protein
MSTVIDLPTPMMYHRRHARSIMSIASSLLTGQPVIGVQAHEANRFLNALAAAINADPSICSKIEEAARTLR